MRCPDQYRDTSDFTRLDRLKRRLRHQRAADVGSRYPQAGRGRLQHGRGFGSQARSERRRIVTTGFGRKIRSPEQRRLVADDEPGGVRALAALDDGAVKQTLTKRRGQQRADTDAPRRGARDRHVVPVAAEGRNILLNPAKRSRHIQQPIISRGRAVRVLRVQPGESKPAEYAEPMVDHDDDHVLRRGERRAVARAGRATREAAAVDVH